MSNGTMEVSFESHCTGCGILGAVRARVLLPLNDNDFTLARIVRQLKQRLEDLTCEKCQITQDSFEFGEL